MLLTPGQTVYLKHSRVWATIFAIEDDYLIIKDDDGSDFYVHNEDVMTAEELAYEKMDIHNDSADKPKDEAPENKPSSLFSLPGKAGFYIVLTSESDQPIVDEYKIWMVNHTEYECKFEGELNSLEGVLHSESSILDAKMQYMFCEMYKEDLSMQAKVDLKLQFEISGETLEQSLRCRMQPKKIISMEKEKDGGLYCRWFEILSEEDIIRALRALKQPVKSIAKKTSDNKRRISIVNINDIEKKASFPTVMDLHAEKILRSPGKMKAKEILFSQMDAFESYMREAIRLGVERVFVVHGIGEGKLKARIHDRLDQMSEVESYRNEHHPRFGWGATEIFL